MTYSWFCNFSFDQQNQPGVSELNIEDFLDNKNDQAFEIQQNQDKAARSPEAQLNSEQNQNKRRRSSAASTSNSSSSSNNSTSSLTTASIKTDFGGLTILNNSGITLNNTQFQGVRVQQIPGIVQQTQFVTVQQAPSQNILPPVPLQNNKKQQQILQNSQVKKKFRMPT